MHMFKILTTKLLKDNSYSILDLSNLYVIHYICYWMEVDTLVYMIYHLDESTYED